MALAVIILLHYLFVVFKRHFYLLLWEAILQVLLYDIYNEQFLFISHNSFYQILILPIHMKLVPF